MLRRWRTLLQHDRLIVTSRCNTNLFVERRLLVSLLTGFLISAVVTFGFSMVSRASLTTILDFLVLFVLASGSYYFGMSLGWDNSSGAVQNGIQQSCGQFAPLPENITIENTPSSLRITIRTKKRWAQFVVYMIQLVVVGLCFSPLVVFALVSSLQNHLPQGFRFVVWIVGGGFVVYLLYKQFQDAIEYIFDQEIIEIDNLSVRIKNAGSVFRKNKEYSADNIKQIMAFGGANPVKGLSFISAKIPAFMLWKKRGLPWYRIFGRGVGPADAQRILAMIYARFPQYKG